MKFRVLFKKGKLSRRAIAGLLAMAALAALYTYRLGSLTHGLSKVEAKVAITPAGWHGLYHQPLFAPITILRSAIFYLFPGYGDGLLRLSNVVFGLIAIIAFYLIIKSWHGARIAILAGLLFATSAFSFHVSRLASNDVMYFVVLPLLFFAYLLPRKYPNSKLPLFFNGLVWISLMFIPGMVWLVLISIYTQLQSSKRGLSMLNIPWKALFALFILAPLSLLGYLIYKNKEVMIWLGLPNQFGKPIHIAKELAAVPFHLFGRGPQYPEIWLGKAPILDIFCFAMCLMGIYFYFTHSSATRTRQLVAYIVVGVILIGLGGAVSIALLVPLLFLLVATGLTSMRQQWLRVFPVNPIARGFGIGLVVIAVVLSCTYNLRAYFVAWPHNGETHQAFAYKR